jgi:pyruvate/2-oxoacid:ferredoxin oxidoreductase beta subunit
MKKQRPVRSADFENCPGCGESLALALWLAAYAEMHSDEVTESAYVLAHVFCDNCETEYPVRIEMQIEMLGVEFGEVKQDEN